MVVLNLIIWLVLLAVLFAVGLLVFMVLWSTAIFLLRPRMRWGWIAGGVPVYGLLFLLLVSGVFWHATRPTTVFEGEFGFPPPTTVTDLRSSMWSLADTGHVYLAFEADPVTVQQIVARGMTIGDASMVNRRSDAPHWWTPTASSTVEVYEGHLHMHGFAREWQLLIYDPAIRQVFWYSEGID